MSKEQETDSQMLSRLGIDAALWAQELVKRGIAMGDPAPGEQLHGWLCNIIMTAYDHGYWKGERYQRACIMRKIANLSDPSYLVCETDAIIHEMAGKLDAHWRLTPRQVAADNAEELAAESKLALSERPEGTSNSPLPDAPKQENADDR